MRTNGLTRRHDRPRTWDAGAQRSGQQKPRTDSQRVNVRPDWSSGFDTNTDRAARNAVAAVLCVWGGCGVAVLLSLARLLWVTGSNLRG